jgi:hypothetical protein
MQSCMPVCSSNIIRHLSLNDERGFCQNSNPNLAERPHFWYTDPIHSKE